MAPAEDSIVTRSLKQENSVPRRRFAIAGLIAVLAGLVPVIAMAESTGDLHVKVVEAGTGKPIANANVRFRGDAREGTFTGHGGRTATLFDLKAATKEQGVAVFPATQFNPRQWGLWGLNTNLDGPRLIVTRPGYRSRDLINPEINPSTKAFIAWAGRQGVIEMTPGTDPDGKNPSQRLDEQDAFIRMVHDPDAMKRAIDLKNSRPPPVPQAARSPAETSQAAPAPAPPNR